MMGSNSKHKSAHEELLHYAKNAHLIEDKINRLEAAGNHAAKQAQRKEAATAEHDKKLAQLDAKEAHLANCESVLDNQKHAQNIFHSELLERERALEAKAIDADNREKSLGGLIKDAQEKQAAIHLRISDLDKREAELNRREIALNKRQEKLDTFLKSL